MCTCVWSVALCTCVHVSGFSRLVSVLYDLFAPSASISLSRRHSFLVSLVPVRVYLSLYIPISYILHGRSYFAIYLYVSFQFLLLLSCCRRHSTAQKACLFVSLVAVRVYLSFYILISY